MCTRLTPEEVSKLPFEVAYGFPVLQGAWEWDEDEFGRFMNYEKVRPCFDLRPMNRGTSLRSKITMTSVRCCCEAVAHSLTTAVGGPPSLWTSKKDLVAQIRTENDDFRKLVSEDWDAEKAFALQEDEDHAENEKVSKKIVVRDIAEGDGMRKKINNILEAAAKLPRRLRRAFFSHFCKLDFRKFYYQFPIRVSHYKFNCTALWNPFSFFWIVFQYHCSLFGNLYSVLNACWTATVMSHCFLSVFQIFCLIYIDDSIIMESSKERLEVTSALVELVYRLQGWGLSSNKSETHALSRVIHILGVGFEITGDTDELAQMSMRVFVPIKKILGVDSLFSCMLDKCSKGRLSYPSKTEFEQLAGILQYVLSISLRKRFQTFVKLIYFWVEERNYKEIYRNKHFKTAIVRQLTFLRKIFKDHQEDFTSRIITLENMNRPRINVYSDAAGERYCTSEDKQVSKATLGGVYRKEEDTVVWYSWELNDLPRFLYKYCSNISFFEHCAMILFLLVEIDFLKTRHIVANLDNQIHAFGLLAGAGGGLLASACSCLYSSILDENDMTSFVIWNASGLQPADLPTRLFRVEAIKRLASNQIQIPDEKIRPKVQVLWEKLFTIFKDLCFLCPYHNKVGDGNKPDSWWMHSLPCRNLNFVMKNGAKRMKKDNLVFSSKDSDAKRRKIDPQATSGSGGIF